MQAATFGGRLKQQLKERARALGFDACGIAPATVPRARQEELRRFIAEGLHGSMQWMETTLSRRLDPRALMPEARSAIVCAMSYTPPPGLDLLARATDKTLGNISVYALSRDYHDVVKGKLKHLAQWLASRSKAEVKVFVDTAPLMEKVLAEQAGIGWAGKHTCVLSRHLGNWFFIGVILTAAELAPDAPATAHCGSCTRCLDICPTNAFIAPHQLDARRCISYLTIEHTGPIPRDLRPLMGNRIFGCDDCLAVCPWNRFARQAREERLHPRQHLRHTPLAELLALDEPGWRKMFAGTPVRRAGYDRFMANVLIACANTGAVPADVIVQALEQGRADDYPLMRAMSVWALSRLLPEDAFDALRQRHQPAERHPWVLAEWRISKNG